MFDPPSLKISRRIRWSDELGVVPTLSKGDQVVAEGAIRYGQDFSFWKGEFPGRIWTVCDVWEDGRVVLESYGYGMHKEPYDHASYGNGRVFVSSESARKCLRRAP